MQPAKFHFKNIGPIKKAELELGDLTIIAGRNNTGKTYIVYTLYGFLKKWDTLPWRMEPDMDIETSEDTADRETIDEKRKKIIHDLAHSFSRKDLAGVFSSPRDAFENASIGVDLPNRFFQNERSGMTLRQSDFRSIRYDGTAIILTGKTEKPRHLPYLHRKSLFPEFPFEPFILPAERLSIPLFYKELDFTKNQLIDFIQKMSAAKYRDGFSLFSVIDKTTSRYALPIKDNIDYTRDLTNHNRYSSELHEEKLFSKVSSMMEGYYRSFSHGVEFISRRKARSFDIPLHIASSSARGLSGLYFYLRNEAWEDQLVIIDEPESHLDTANQILLARLLTRMVQAGLKVLITTHSDYIIKEINNLIMLSRSFKNKKKVIKDLGYKEDDFLDPESVRAYVADGDSLGKCDIDGFGIDMPVFDETIDEINRISNELASRLEEDGDR